MAVVAVVPQGEGSGEVAPGEVHGEEALAVLDDHVGERDACDEDVEVLQVTVAMAGCVSWGLGG